jgi:hypothetical protein
MWEKHWVIFLGGGKQSDYFYNEINGNFIFDLHIFTLRPVFIERITFVNRGMGIVVRWSVWPHINVLWILHYWICALMTAYEWSVVLNLLCEPSRNETDRGSSRVLTHPPERKSQKPYNTGAFWTTPKSRNTVVLRTTFQNVMFQNAIQIKS